MADFYPLLDRAIRGLPDNTPDARNALFARARDVLHAQLRGMDPPLPEADITHEMSALEEVIARVEREQLPAPAAPQPPAATMPPTVAAPEIAQPATPSAPVSPNAPASAPASPATTPAGSGAAASTPKPASQLGHTGTRPAHGMSSGDKPAVVVAKPVQPEISASDGEPRFRPPPARPGNGRRNALIGGLVIALVAVAGVAYWANKVNHPAPHQQDASAAGVVDPGNDQKYGQRVGAGAGTAAQQGAATQPGQAVEGAQRAILYEEAADSPQSPKVLQGHVTWRLDSENPGQNQPLENVVRADVTIPDAGLELKITLRRNTDAALPASHLMELTFKKTGAGEGRVIRDVGVPQFKNEENARGVPLAGLPVAVSETVFLVGLSNLPSDVERNVDLIRNRPWIDLPVRYDNGRRAVIALEKGASGDRVIADAFKSWGVAAN